MCVFVRVRVCVCAWRCVRIGWMPSQHKTEIQERTRTATDAERCSWRGRRRREPRGAVRAARRADTASGRPETATRERTAVEA